MADTTSTPELVRQATQQISTLVRDELRLAQAEIAAKARHAGAGVGMFAAAAVVVFYGVGAVLVAAGFALALVLPGWAAALVVAVLLFIVGAALGLLGRSQLNQATPAKPEQAISGVRADIDTVTSAIDERRRT